MLEQAPAPMWLSALDGRALWLNRAWLAFTGATFEQALALPWTHWVHPDDLAPSAAVCLGAIERREPFESSARVRRFDGHWRWVENRGVPFTDALGQVVAYLGTFTDVTEQRIAEARLHLVLDHIGGAAFLHTPDGRYLYVNKEWHALFNPDGREVIGRRVTDFFPQAIVDEIRRSNDTAATLGGRMQYESTMPTLVGPRRFLVTKFLLQDPVGGMEAFCGVATDLTEYHDRELHSRAIERRLHEARHLESLGVLAGGIAHDFNNLLQSMLGHASLLAAELPADAPGREHVEPIEVAAARAAGLTRQLLDYAGLSMHERGPVDLSALLARWEQDFRPAVPPHVSLHLRLAGDLPRIQADAGRLRTALSHLATNAVEAIGERAGQLVVRVYVRDPGLPTPCVPQGLAPLSDGKWVVMEVEDDGDGMDERILSRLWDPFFSTRFPGRGLGLPAALGIARAHGGTIEVTSAPGAGSTFRLVLPVDQPSRNDSRNAGP